MRLDTSDGLRCSRRQMRFMGAMLVAFGCGGSAGRDAGTARDAGPDAAADAGEAGAFDAEPFDAEPEDGGPPAPPPELDSVEPEVAYVGEVVTLNGRGFDPLPGEWPDEPWIDFSGRRVRVQPGDWSDTEIRVRVPDGTPSGEGTVQVVRDRRPGNALEAEIHRLVVVTTTSMDVYRIDATQPDLPVLLEVLSVAEVAVDVSVALPSPWTDVQYDPIAVVASGATGVVSVIDLLAGSVESIDSEPSVSCAWGSWVCVDHEGSPDTLRPVEGDPDSPRLGDPLEVPNVGGERLTDFVTAGNTFASVIGESDYATLHAYGPDGAWVDRWLAEFEVGRLAERLAASERPAGIQNAVGVLNRGDDMGFGAGLEGSVSLVAAAEAFEIDTDDDWGTVSPADAPDGITRLAAPGARDIAFGPDGYTLLVPVGIPDSHEVWVYDVSMDWDVPPADAFTTGAEGGMPTGIAVSAADARAFVVDGDPAQLIVVDLSGDDPEVRGSLDVPGAVRVAVQP